MKKRTFKKLVALLRPALERYYCMKYVYVFYKCYNRWTDSVCVADGHI